MAEHPTISAEQLRCITREEALALVDQLLGAPDSWPSPLIRYRLSADFQSDWKEELGHWLKTAERLGFLDRVMHEIQHQAKRRSKKDDGTINANDERHLKLHHHLAATRVAHYLTGTGWGFIGYEPLTGGSIDIDLSLASPDGGTVEFQVKAPDQPGVVVKQQIQEGEFDSRILLDADKAATQLRCPATTAALIAICANRTFPFAWSPAPLVTHLIGSTMGYEDGRVHLASADRGLFFTESWQHVSGVMILDIARGVSEVLYPCTVLLNPLARFPAQPSWFQHGRVSYLENGIFRWLNSAPQNGATVPDGTVLLE